MKEVWKPIPTKPGYEASNMGRIKSVAHWVNVAGKKPYFLKEVILVLSKARSGYRRFSNGRGAPKAVHCAVLEAFVGPRSTPAHQGAHWDGDKSNNRLENLRWATPKENCEDKRRHGRMGQLHGELSPWAVMTAEKVRELRRRAAAGGEKQRDIARSYGISFSHANGIIKGRFWKLPEHFDAPKDGETANNGSPVAA